MYWGVFIAALIYILTVATSLYLVFRGRDRD